MEKKPDRLSYGTIPDKYNTQFNVKKTHIILVLKDVFQKVHEQQQWNIIYFLLLLLLLFIQLNNIIYVRMG